MNDTPESPPSEQPKHSWNPFFRDIIIFLLIVVCIRSLAFEPFHIPSGSMKSNLLIGDYLLVSKYSYGYSRFSFPFGVLLPFHGRFLELDKPERGDVVVFRLPNNPTIDYIKRIMGLPGDHIQVKEGVVYINGKALPREYQDNFTDPDDPVGGKITPRYKETLLNGKVISILQETTTQSVDNTGIYIVPPDHYFMMGDNRNESQDSRFTNAVGYVPAENLVGKAQIIVFSIAFNQSHECTESWAARAPSGAAKVSYYAEQVWSCLPSLRVGRSFTWIH